MPQVGEYRPGDQELRRESDCPLFLFRLMLSYRRLRTHLTARIGILGRTLSFVAAIASLLAGEEQAQAIPALQKEEGGGKKQSDDSSAPHKFIVGAPYRAGQNPTLPAALKSRAG